MFCDLHTVYNIVMILIIVISTFTIYCGTFFSIAQPYMVHGICYNRLHTLLACTNTHTHKCTHTYGFLYPCKYPHGTKETLLIRNLTHKRNLADMYSVYVKYMQYVSGTCVLTGNSIWLLES